MLRKKSYFKIFSSSVLVLVVLWLATPKVYIHDLLNHNHNLPVKISSSTSIDHQSTDDCEFDKYNTPVHFSLFKFINDLLPLKPQNSTSFFQKTLNLFSISNAIYQLRAPPTA
jgi:hypothetical protein